MGKFTFNTSIGMDMKAASADSFVDNIQMIEFSEIKQNKDNFLHALGAGTAGR